MDPVCILIQSRVQLGGVDNLGRARLDQTRDRVKDAPLVVVIVHCFGGLEQQRGTSIIGERLEHYREVNKRQLGGCSCTTCQESCRK